MGRKIIFLSPYSNANFAKLFVANVSRLLWVCLFGLYRQPMIIIMPAIHWVNFSLSKKLQSGYGGLENVSRAYTDIEVSSKWMKFQCFLKTKGVRYSAG